MPKSSALSNAILGQLSSVEQKKLKKLEKTHFDIGQKMIKAQSAYTQYVRKTKNSDPLKARKLADEGFKYESLAVKARHELVKYKDLLKKKYS